MNHQEAYWKKRAQDLQEAARKVIQHWDMGDVTYHDNVKVRGIHEIGADFDALRAAAAPDAPPMPSDFSDV